MLKSKRTVIVLLVVLAASMLFAAVASADNLAGTGWIRAEGDGRAALQGDARTVHLSGNGILWFKDEGEVDEPVVTGYGHSIEYPDGWVKYFGFRGQFHISDADDVTVILVGKNVNLFAAGQGRVYLEGEGYYIVGRGPHWTRGEWSPSGTTLELTAE
jgi:hypothetical protein